MINTLQSIAALCPFEDGIGVYQARMLLQPYDSTYYINFCETYADNNLRIGGNNEEEEPYSEVMKNQFYVFPNPATDEINISYNLVNNEFQSQVMLYNYTGEVVYSQIIGGTAGNLCINTQSFASGVYLLRIQGYDSLLYSEKIVVIP